MYFQRSSHNKAFRRLLTRGALVIRQKVSYKIEGDFTEAHQACHRQIGPISHHTSQIAQLIHFVCPQFFVQLVIHTLTLQCTPDAYDDFGSKFTEVLPNPDPLILNPEPYMLSPAKYPVLKAAWKL